MRKRNQKLINQVIKYRQQGVSNRKMAALLGVSESTIHHTAGKLVRLGILPRAKTGTKPNPNSQKMQVYRLYIDGYSPIEISQMIRLRREAVSNYITTLRREGMLPPSDKRNVVSPEEWERRINLVLPLLQAGLSSAEIIKQNVVPKELLSNIVARIYEGNRFSHEKRIEAKNARIGQMVLPLVKDGFSTSEIAERLNFKVGTIDAALSRLKAFEKWWQENKAVYIGIDETVARQIALAAWKAARQSKPRSMPLLKSKPRAKVLIIKMPKKKAL